MWFKGDTLSEFTFALFKFRRIRFELSFGEEEKKKKKKQYFF